MHSKYGDFKIFPQGAKDPPTKKGRSFALFFLCFFAFVSAVTRDSWDSSGSMIGRADIRGSKSNVVMNDEGLA